MKLILKSFIFLLLFIQFLTANSTFLTQEEKEYLKNKVEIKICVLPSWLPFEQINKNNKHKGVGADVVNIISKNLNTPFTLVPTKKWSKSLQNLRDRKCDVLPVAMALPSRKDSMNFTKPYVTEPIVIATKQDKLFIKDSKGIGNKKIGIVKGYALIEVLKKRNPKIEIITVKNAEDGLEKVQKGEIYGYMDILSAIISTIQQNSILDLKIAGKMEFDLQISMASRNDEPLLNSILEKSLDNIGEDEIKKIVGKWLTIKVEERVDYSLIVQITTAFILVLLVILYKNKQVNKINKKLQRANSEVLEQQNMVDKYVMILSTDLEGKITQVNDAYCKKIGFSKQELIGNTHSIMRHDEMSDEFFEELWKDIKANKVWQDEIKNLKKCGKEVYFNVVIEPLIKDGKKIGYRSISEDITDKKRIEELSITDNLTGLFNRLKIDEILLDQVNTFNRYKNPFSVILLDVDNFKAINDNYGHDVGDKVLKNLAKYLNKKIRKTDYIGRWGGEEFIIICSNTNANNAFILAEHIREYIQEQEFENVAKLTISLGISEFEKDDSISFLFKKADNALYKSKNSGKNQTNVIL